MCIDNHAWVVLVEGMPYEAEEVEVREEFSFQKLLCETQQHVEGSEGYNCLSNWLGLDCNFN